MIRKPYPSPDAVEGTCKGFYARERADGQGEEWSSRGRAPADVGPGRIRSWGPSQGRRRRTGSASGPRQENRENYDLLESLVTTTPPASMRAHSEPALIRCIAPVFATGVLPESRCYLAARRIGRQFFFCLRGNYGLRTVTMPRSTAVSLKVMAVKPASVR